MKMLTLKQVAEKLGCHPATVKRMIEAGRLPAVRLAGGRGHYRVSEDALMAFVEARHD